MSDSGSEWFQDLSYKLNQQLISRTNLNCRKSKNGI